MTPEQEHFWKVLKFDAKTMAIELGTIMEDAKVKYGSNSKKFHAAADRCFFLVMNQAQTDMDVVRIVKHWLSVMHLPLDPSKLASTDYFHNRYGKLILDLVDSRQSMDWN